MKLTRYWFTFTITDDDKHPLGVLKGCGITAYGYDDAMTILQDVVFKGCEPPLIKDFIEDVDISNLDEKHVRLNMGNVLRRGVWFPLGYKL